MLIYMIKNFMHTKFAIQDLLSLQLHNLNSEDKSSFKELRDFFMQAPVPLAILKGPEHFFTLSNTDYEKLIGRSAMGKNLLEVFSKDELDESLDILNHVYKTGIPFIGKELILNLNDKDGVVQQKWIDVAYHPFRENNEDEIKGIFAVFQDVTDRVIAKENITKNEAALKQAIELLELERDIREKLISALSHDMRTPLAAAKLSAQILTRKRPDEATILRVSNRIAKNMDRADRMIQDILDASHIKAGERVALEIASFDLKELMVNYFCNELESFILSDESTGPLLISEPFKVLKGKIDSHFEDLKGLGFEFYRLNAEYIVLRTIPKFLPQSLLFSLSESLITYFEKQKGDL